jgi:hypothetical protein
VPDESPRPKLRPKTVLPYDDIEKIERLVWAESRGEGQEGRDAVRGVILNRLASDRFPNTIDEILTEDQFEPIATYGSIFDIPAPREDLNEQINEFVDYVQLGEDAVDGRTFFQNTKTTKKRGTDFTGPDPIIIGNHTFTRGYSDSEPVYDTHFSHDVQVIYPEYAGGEFSLGGLAEAQKGITTQEGKEMANKRFQLDERAADLDGNGELSKYEETRGEAIQQAMVDDPESDEKGMNCGGMMEPVDPVSGNPIPPGSTASNVRDDIPAWLSEGEYVLPADVVKWHGLKHIMEMQEEAKMGLMMMTDMGLIVETEMEDYEHVEDAEASEETEVEETPEGNEVEYPAVETVEEFIEGDTSEEYDEEEEYATESTPSMYGTVTKPKVAFIV